MSDSTARKTPGRPLTKTRDATMSWIAQKHLWNAVALQCGITPGAVRLWRRVPSARVRDVERATGRRRSLIRPDLYRRDKPQTA